MKNLKPRYLVWSFLGLMLSMFIVWKFFQLETPYYLLVVVPIGLLAVISVIYILFLFCVEWWYKLFPSKKKLILGVLSDSEKGFNDWVRYVGKSTYKDAIFIHVHDNLDFHKQIFNKLVNGYGYYKLNDSTVEKAKLKTLQNG